MVPLFIGGFDCMQFIRLVDQLPFKVDPHSDATFTARLPSSDFILWRDREHFARPGFGELVAVLLLFKVHLQPSLPQRVLGGADFKSNYRELC